MSLWDPSDLPALSTGDLAIRELLRVDRDNAGEGVSRAELEVAGGLRELTPSFRRLHKHGCLIGRTPAGLFQLGHEEADAERTIDESHATIVGKDDQPFAARPVDGSLSGGAALFDAEAYRRAAA